MKYLARVHVRENLFRKGSQDIDEGRYFESPSETRGKAQARHLNRVE